MELILMQDINYVDKMKCATYIEHSVFDMLEGDIDCLGLYAILKKLHNKEWGYACPSVRHNPRGKKQHTSKDLVTLTGKSEVTIRSMIKRLENIGLIRTKRVVSPTGNKKLLFYLYQPLIVKQEELDNFKEDLESKKVFVAANSKDSLKR